MQLFSAVAIVEKIKKKNFCPWKIEKTTQKSCSESSQTPFSHSPAQATAHSPKLIFHIMKFGDQTSVLCVSVFMIVLKPPNIEVNFKVITYECPLARPCT